jgi:two-component system, chemotaxis family, CheB/CheR fusion protein
MMTGRRLGRSRVAAPTPAKLAMAGRAHSGSDRIINTIRQPLLVLDDELRVISANHAFYRAFAVTPQKTVGQPLAAIGDHRLDVPSLRSFLDLIRADGATIEDYEIEIDLPPQGRRLLVLEARQIRDGRGATREILVTIEDVTERKRAEAALMAAKWHAERASLSKSRLLSTVSHDLRQPLQALILMRGILAKGIKDEEGLKLVAQLNKTSDSMLGMLNSLLNINQLETGIVHPEKINFPIHELLEQLRIEFTFHAQAHGLALHVVPCRLSVWSDPHLLQQMIRNLLSNAVKYTERGKILLGCRRRGEKLRIEVWDTGPGIAEEQFDAIFTEFHKLDNPVSGHSLDIGIGLGLPIVQRLANLLGHSVDVHSRRGKGSVFAVETTLAGEQTGALLRPRQWGRAHAADIHAAILIVEDDRSVREMLDLLFTREGHRTVAAEDGDQALMLVPGTINPDIVVADYSLPNGMTGPQIIARVRQTVGREIPAIVLTGNISTDTMREITRYGCVQRTKPVRAEELTHLVQSLLNKARQPIAQKGSLPQAGSKADMRRPTIFVVDDESAVREAMRALLHGEGWSVEAYSSGEEFLEAYRPGREGCLVVDAWMPRMGGLELLERLKTEHGGPPAIMITGHADIRLAVQAMKAGAVAFLEKPVRYDELLYNIERALEFSRNAAAIGSLREAVAKRMAGLTARERQVVELVVEGNPNKQIAYVLGISQRTIETHRATAMKKLGARSLSELIHLTIAGSTQET